jgi:type IV pilus assembly protein PilM
MVDWNREISAGRKERGSSETSIWKKEISFGRKRKEEQAAEPLAEAPVAEAPVAETPPAETLQTLPVETPPLVETPPIAEPVLAPSPAPLVAPEPVVAAEPEPAVAPEPEPVVAPDPEPVVAAEPPRVPEPAVVAEREVVPEAALDPEPLAVPEPPTIAEPVSQPAAEAVQPGPAVVEPVLEVTRAAEAAPPAAAAAVEMHVEPPAVQLPTIELETAGAPQPPLSAAAAPSAEPAAPLPEASSDYGWLTDGLDEQPARPAPVQPTPARPEPAQLEQAQPEFPALDLLEGLGSEPEADGDEKVPFWKKDVSFSRKPKTERAPKEKRSKERGEAGRPFWKRELSLARTPKAAASKDPAARAETPTSKEKSVPFWKRDLSFGKKGAKAPNGAKAPKGARAPKGAARGLKAQPFWKKDLTFGRSADAAKTAPVRGRKKVKKGKKEMVVGLKIGASQLAAARVVNNGSPELVQVAREPLEDGIIVGGELRDPETLAEELSAFFARHKLPKRNVRLGIANNRIGVRTFEISGIDDPRQLANAIRFRAQETLPIPLEEAVLDWQVLSETHDEEVGTTRRVLLVVAYRELVDRYVAACKKAGVRLAGIDLEAFAMLRAVIPPPPAGAPDPDGASVVVNVGHDRSTLAVSDGHICEFTRVLSWGGQSLSVSIARALDQTPSEVEPLKHALVLGGTIAPPDGFSQEQTDAANEAVSRELQAFARELVSSLRFYQNQPGSLGIGQIVLTGGTSHMPGLSAELERLIGVTVRVGDPLGRVKVSKRFKDPDQIGSFAVAVGLGIDD